MYVSLTHPYGTSGSFTLKDTYHRFGLYNVALRTEACPDIERFPVSGLSYPMFPTFQTGTISVTSKSLSGPSMPTASWYYAYERDNGSSPAGDHTNWTRVTGPNTHITYYHQWTPEALGGKLLKKEIRNSGNAPILETTNYGYHKENGVGSTFVYGSGNRAPVLPTSTVTSRSGDIFTTPTQITTITRRHRTIAMGTRYPSRFPAISLLRRAPL